MVRMVFLLLIVLPVAANAWSGDEYATQTPCFRTAQTTKYNYTYTNILDGRDGYMNMLIYSCRTGNLASGNSAFGKVRDGATKRGTLIVPGPGSYFVRVFGLGDWTLKRKKQGAK